MRSYFLWLAKLITLIVVFLFIVPFALVMLVAAIASTDIDKLKDEKNLVAVIRLEGMIDDSKELIDALYKQADNDKIKGIVLRINSPGGAVGPSQDIYTAIRKLKEKKPIVASMSSVAASGGFYAAMAASKVYAQPGTVTGSIGVVLQIPNVSEISRNIGVDLVTIKSGALKDVGNAFRDMTPEEREFLQNTVGIVHEEFVKDVMESRGLTREEVMRFADGRVIVGSQAKQYKLVDEFGDIYDAARAVFELLGEPLKEDERPKLIHIDDKFVSFRRWMDTMLKIPELFAPRFSIRYALY